MKYFDALFKFLLFYICILPAFNTVMARPGDLDSLFGNNGVVIKRWGAGEDTYKDVLQLPDGKIMVLAKDAAFNVILARYNANGTIDTTFDFDGFAIHSMGSVAYVNAMALQADGKILVAGTRRNGSDDEVMVLRFKPDGSLDNTFAVNGKFFINLSGGDEYAEYLRIQPNGSILVVASNFVNLGDISDMVIMRLWPSGVLDLHSMATG
jgi:uncharacterized delta-60 repeat protein